VRPFLLLLPNSSTHVCVCVCVSQTQHTWKTAAQQQEAGKGNLDRDIVKEMDGNGTYILTLLSLSLPALTDSITSLIACSANEASPFSPQRCLSALAARSSHHLKKRDVLPRS
jgi:hypothetical protein